MRNSNSIERNLLISECESSSATHSFVSHCTDAAERRTQSQTVITVPSNLVNVKPPKGSL
jgi:hypothetical protein